MPGERELAQATEKALCFLDMRDHATHELYTKLCRSFAPETAAAAVRQVCDMGACNDAGFAQHRAQSLQNKGKSRREISAALAALRIERADISAALDALEYTEQEICEALLRRKYARRLSQGETQKTAAALARRGFGYSDINRALEQYGAEVAQTEF